MSSLVMETILLLVMRKIIVLTQEGAMIDLSEVEEMIILMVVLDMMRLFMMQIIVIFLLQMIQFKTCGI